MTACPPEDALQALLSGRLSAAEVTALHRHVDGCPACMELLLALGEDDTAERPDPAAAPPGETPPASTPRTTPADLVSASAPRSRRFDVLRCLGEGGMGAVYEALDRERGVKVALKTVRALSGGSSSRILGDGADRSPAAGTRRGALVQRFKNEFRALQDLAHPSLVSLFDLFEEGGQWFFSMELVRGVDFLAHVRPGGVLDEGRLRAALRQLAEGLAALHGAGKIHRDVKPSNLLVEGGGRVVVLDLGLVADADAGHDLTEDRLVGTVAYMAPEQAQGARPDAAADWYSVGVLLYEALAGRLPFSGPPLKVLRDKVETPPPALTEGPADLRALCADLLQVEAARRPGGAEVLRRLGAGATPAAAPVPAAQAPFVGRDGELAALAAAAADARQGRPVTVLVEGESGVGKTALCRRFLGPPGGDGPVVLAGRCYEREAIPYKALDGVIDALARFLRQLPADEVAALLPRRAGLLPQVFPVLGRVPAVATAPAQETPDPRELASRVFLALRELLARLADRRALVLFIDDLQWADADSLRLLQEILRPPDGPALLLLATVRGEGAPEALAAALPGDLRRVALGPLPGAEAEALARTLLLLRGVAPRGEDGDAARLAREAAGHPLFLDALCRDAATAAPAGGDGLTLEALLLRHAAALPADARALLEAVVLATAPLPEEVAAAAAGLAPDALPRALGRLRQDHLVLSGTRAPGLIEPYHDRVRQAVASHLDDGARAAVHRRLAAALQGRPGADPEALGFHLLQAGERGAAARYLTEAAALADAALAFGRAAELYRRALELDGADDALQERLALALANEGRAAESGGAFLVAADRAGEDRRFDLRCAAARQLMRAGQFAPGLAVLDGVLDEAGLSRPRTPLGRALSILYHSALRRLRGTRYRERPESEVPPLLVRQIELCWLASSSLVIFDAIARVDYQLRAYLLALRSGEPARVAKALALDGSIGQMRPDGPARRRALRTLEMAEDLARRLDYADALGWASIGRGLATYCEGGWRASARTFADAETLFRDRCIGAAWEIASARIFRLYALVYLGELRTLEREVAESAKEARQRQDLFMQGSIAYGPTILLRLAHDEPEAARREASEAVARWPPARLSFYEVYELFAQVLIDLYQGEGDAALERLRLRWPARAIRRIPYFHIWPLYLRGSAAVRAARGRGGDRALLRAAERDAARVTAFERRGQRWAAALGALLLANVRAARGDAAAPAAAGAAVDALRAVDMGVHAAAALRLQGQLTGGDAGAALVREADGWLTAQGVRRPARLCATLAPALREG